MARVAKGFTILGAAALAGAAGLLVVTVLRAVSVDPMGVDPVGVDPAGPDPAGPDAAGPHAVGVEAVAEPALDGVGPAAEEGPGDEVQAVERRRAEEAVAAIGARGEPGASEPAAWDDPLTLAVDNDPFSPRRRPPAQRYRLPGEREPVVREEPRERPEAPDFRVVGSASMEGGGLALVQVGGGEPRLVALGESLRGYTLTEVDGESATLVGPAGQWRFPVMEPTARGDDDDDDDRRRRGRESEVQERERAIQLRLMRQQMQQMQRLQEFIRLRGGSGFTWTPGVLPEMPVVTPRVRIRPGGSGTDAYFLTPVPVPDATRRGGGGDAPPASQAP